VKYSKLAQHLTIQGIADSGLLFLPGNHMTDDALENISVIDKTYREFLP